MTGRRLYDHYGLAHSQEESPTVLPEGAAPATEERPRLRKHIEVFTGNQ